MDYKSNPDMLYTSCYENNNGSLFTKQEWSITKTWQKKHLEVTRD